MFVRLAPSIEAGLSLQLPPGCQSIDYNLLVFTCGLPAVFVEMNTLRTTHDWHFKPAVMLANALTAFILNLVRV